MNDRTMSLQDIFDEPLWKILSYAIEEYKDKQEPMIMTITDSKDDRVFTVTFMVEEEDYNSEGAVH